MGSQNKEGIKWLLNSGERVLVVGGSLELIQYLKELSANK